ncbi:hypothetical protein LOS15_10095 [Halomonas sp. 7T]|nr:hypothetical protein [Halomonas sp. 7T]UXZ53195.1 hypothetical protein LOS15_10095 [Halomonas sp. 7T]
MLKTITHRKSALKGSEYIRLRVGDWQVIIDERGDVLDIINIGAHGGVY